MVDDSFVQLEALFHEARQLSDKHERMQYLDEQCGRETELRAAIDRLLAADERRPEFPTEKWLEAGKFATTESTHNGIVSALQHHSPADEVQSYPNRILHYEVLELIGKGGGGYVLKAFDTALNRIVALKIPQNHGDTNAIHRLMREARSAAAISHDHVTRVFAVNDEPPVISMEYVDGPSLQQLVDMHGKCSLLFTLKIGVQLVSALTAAHGMGIVHRDIKPSNVLVDSNLERVKLADFGLARSSGDVGVTATGQLIGTPRYMSPEQASGRQADVRSDLFSLGATLYFACSGVHPVGADSALEAIDKIRHEKPDALSKVDSTIPSWFSSIVESMMAKAPEERPQTAKEVGNILQQGIAHVQDPVRFPAPRSKALRGIPSLFIPAQRINIYALFLFVHMLSLAGLAIASSFAPRSLLWAMPIVGMQGLGLCYTARRISDPLGTLIGVTSVGGVCLSVVAMASGVLHPNNVVSSFQPVLLGLLLFQLPLGLIAFIRSLHRLRDTPMKFRFSMRDLLKASIVLAIALAIPPLLQNTTVGFAVEVATIVLCLICLLGFLLCTDAHYTKVAAKLVGTRKRQWWTLFTAQLLLCFVLFCTAHLLTSRYGQLSVNFELAPPPRTVTSIRNRDTFETVFVEKTRTNATYRLRPGNYEMIVTSPNQNDLIRSVVVTGRQTTTLSISDPSR